MPVYCVWMCILVYINIIVEIFDFSPQFVTGLESGTENSDLCILKCATF